MNRRGETVLPGLARTTRWPIVAQEECIAGIIIGVFYQCYPIRELERICNVHSAGLRSVIISQSIMNVKAT